MVAAAGPGAWDYDLSGRSRPSLTVVPSSGTGAGFRQDDAELLPSASPTATAPRDSEADPALAIAVGTGIGAGVLALVAAALALRCHLRRGHRGGAAAIQADGEPRASRLPSPAGSMTVLSTGLASPSAASVHQVGFGSGSSLARPRSQLAPLATAEEAATTSHTADSPTLAEVHRDAPAGRRLSGRVQTDPVDFLESADAFLARLDPAAKGTTVIAGSSATGYVVASGDAHAEGASAARSAAAERAARKNAAVRQQAW